MLHLLPRQSYLILTNLTIAAQNNPKNCSTVIYDIDQN